MSSNGPKIITYGADTRLGPADALWELVRALESHRGDGGEIWRNVTPDPDSGTVTATLMDYTGSLGKVVAHFTVEATA
ncbi:hypothetical protein ACGFJ7_24395 [Actinoplanes sp. NPDC048988]|uniref:hypothetical protein n=1 Tax=Actinoplanes sp. NPDC048988 TaxID=3363901 RepID=UPI00371EA455